MKHVFYIHSYVTYVVSMGTIHLLGLRSSDVKFIYSRGFNDTYNDYARLNITGMFEKLFEAPSFASRFFYWKNFCEINSLDKYISNLVGKDSFIIYVPLNKSFITQLLLSHSKCIGINYIEEGLLTYTGNFVKKKYFYDGIKGKLKLWLNVGGRSYYRVNSRYKDNKPVLYSLFDKKLYNTDLDVKQVNIADIGFNSDFKLENATVVIFNSFDEGDELALDELIDIVANYFINYHTQIYIKFHPVKNEIFENGLCDRFMDLGIDYNVIPNCVNTEMLILKSTSLHVYGFFSSPMFYAAEWGHEVFSFNNTLKQYENANKYLSKYNVPDIFSRNIKMI